MAEPEPMTAEEEQCCKAAFAAMTNQQISPASSYGFLLALRDGLEELGSKDPEGKALAFLFFITMRTAQGVAGRARR